MALLANDRELILFENKTPSAHLQDNLGHLSSAVDHRHYDANALV
jgi:hypothetical protein